MDAAPPEMIEKTADITTVVVLNLGSFVGFIARTWVDDCRCIGTRVYMYKNTPFAGYLRLDKHMEADQARQDINPPDDSPKEQSGLRPPYLTIIVWPIERPVMRMAWRIGFALGNPLTCELVIWPMFRIEIHCQTVNSRATLVYLPIVLVLVSVPILGTTLDIYYCNYILNIIKLIG